MKYILGSLVISFGIMFVVVVLLISINLTLTEDILKYLALAWGLLAVAVYPLSKKIIRHE
tara:strand:+ start:15 stop:194 length:180 start_codon:yes stop_codon:yes gene_type:complete